MIVNTTMFTQLPQLTCDDERLVIPNAQAVIHPFDTASLLREGSNVSPVRDHLRSFCRCVGIDLGRVMPLARRFAAALAIVGAGILAYAVPVSASAGDPTHGGDCVDGRVRTNLDAHVDAVAGTATVKGVAPLCDSESADLWLSIYRVPDKWDGGGFDASAVPQDALSHDHGTLSGDETLSLSVDVPTCGNVQIDLYYPPKIEHVTGAGHGSQFIAGLIWSIGGPNGQPAECEHPTTTPPTTPSTTPPTSPTTSPTTTPPTTPHSTSPVTTPTTTPRVAVIPASATRPAMTPRFR
jgi:hypothetical protein